MKLFSIDTYMFIITYYCEKSSAYRPSFYGYGSILFQIILGCATELLKKGAVEGAH